MWYTSSQIPASALQEFRSEESPRLKIRVEVFGDFPLSEGDSCKQQLLQITHVSSYCCVCFSEFIVVKLTCNSPLKGKGRLGSNLQAWLDKYSLRPWNHDCGLLLQRWTKQPESLQARFRLSPPVCARSQVRLWDNCYNDNIYIYIYIYYIYIYIHIREREREKFVNIWFVKLISAQPSAAGFGARHRTGSMAPLPSSEVCAICYDVYIYIYIYTHIHMYINYHTGTRALSDAYVLYIHRYRHACTHIHTTQW